MHDFAHIECCSAMGTLNAHMHDCWGSAGSRVCEGMRPQRERASALCCTARDRHCARLALPQACSIVSECATHPHGLRWMPLDTCSLMLAQELYYVVVSNHRALTVYFVEETGGLQVKSTLQGLHGLCSGRSRKDIEVSPSMLLP